MGSSTLRKCLVGIKKTIFQERLIQIFRAPDSCQSHPKQGGVADLITFKQIALPIACRYIRARLAAVGSRPPD